MERTMKRWIADMLLFPSTCVLYTPCATKKFQETAAALIRKGGRVDAEVELFHVPPGCRGEVVPYPRIVPGDRLYAGGRLESGTHEIDDHWEKVLRIKP